MGLRHRCNEKMVSARIEDLIWKIEQDNTSGAVELTRKGAAVLALLTEETTAPETSQFLSELLSVGRKLIKAQPSMAPLFNLVNTVLSSVDTAEDAKEARNTAKAAAQNFATAVSVRGEKIGLEALSLISDGSTVLTHSHSSTVLGAFLLARARGRGFQVLCTESRPMEEGQELARELAQEGIEATLIIDSAVSHFVSQVDVVMVGADSISRPGLVNKIGTYGVALASTAHEVPFYTLCGTEKFLPLDYPYLEIQQKDPREVWDDYPEGVTVVNYYFDVTPLEYVSGLVTEKGILVRSEVEEMLSRLKVHKLLLEGGRKTQP